MPTILFDGQSIDISAEGYEKITNLYRSSFVHTPDGQHEAILDILFDEGLLCDVCGKTVATQQTQCHGDISLCDNCATAEPGPEEDDTP